MKKVFLGGTCNGSNWRELLIPMLAISYFNPVVEKWTEECRAEEIKQRSECDFCLYVITPKMMGVYSIAEVVDDSNKRPGKVVFCVINGDEDSYFQGHEMKSLDAVKALVASNGGTVLDSLEEVATYLNSNKDEHAQQRITDTVMGKY